MNDPLTSPVNPAYIGDFNRILRSMASRLHLMGEAARVSEISNQVAIRSFTLNVTSARREVTATRAVCRAFIDDGVWPEGVIDTPLFTGMTREDVEQVLDFVSLPVSELVKIGQDLIEEISENRIKAGYSGSGEDLAQSLSGVFPSRARGASPDRTSHVGITEGDLSRIDFHMMDRPHEESIQAFAGPRNKVIALTRVFLKVIWLTGMRPIEVFTCQLMAGDPGRDYTYAQLGMIRKNPEKAAMTGLLIPQEALPGAEEIGHSRAVLDAVRSTGIDPLLVIRNAKTRNANRNLVRSCRVQVLSGISEEDLHLVSIAALLHRNPIRAERARDLINMITRRIRSISKGEFPERDNPINLYALRHDFATRARRMMPLHQVAVLMGHTSYASTRGYGKAQTKRSRSGSGGGGWIPRCDETVAKALQSAFSLSMEARSTEPGMAPEN